MPASSRSPAQFTGVIVLGLIAALLLGVTTYYGFIAPRGAEGQELVVRAKVLAKRAQMTDPAAASAPRLFVKFQLEDGHEVAFKVTDAQYRALKEGTWGRLTYQGTWFKKFQEE
ncbi:MAG: DUF2500 domain-containing protein [Verrucomicrobia bacterium]|nr:DUF2500 domain-containing protein [Verrucomicrobiota bacterium]